jgi:hypothetical protein
MARYFTHMKELMHLAREKGLRGLTVEVMSSSYEPPSTPQEIEGMMQELESYHRAHAQSTVPVYLCGDISHGLADADRRVVHGNAALFEHAIPFMAELHIKNTDAGFDSTFGFSPRECERGIVSLEALRELINRNSDRFPVSDLVGYLEHPGPKTGRDYSDNRLEGMLEESLRAVTEAFERQPATADPEDAAGASDRPRRSRRKPATP